MLSERSPGLANASRSTPIAKSRFVVAIEVLRLVASLLAQDDKRGKGQRAVSESANTAGRSSPKVFVPEIRRLLSLGFARQRFQHHVDQRQHDGSPKGRPEAVDHEIRRQQGGGKHQHQRIDDQPEEPKGEKSQRQGNDFQEEPKRKST